MENINLFFIFEATMSFVDLIQYIESFSHRGADCVATIHKFTIVTDVFVNIVHQLLRDLDADFGHITVLSLTNLVPLVMTSIVPHKMTV